jgi:hypothetical protein
MNYILPNTPDQSVYFTAFELRRYYDAFTNYLLVFGMDFSNDDTIYALIPEVDEDNQRYSKFTISTDANDGANASVLIPDTVHGLFRYRIYGQNSGTNLSPSDASVVAMVEQGYIQVNSEVEYFNEQGGSLPTFVTYGGQ